jgi:hypothetical protein
MSAPQPTGLGVNPNPAGSPTLQGGNNADVTALLTLSVAQMLQTQMKMFGGFSTTKPELGAFDLSHGKHGNVNTSIHGNSERGSSEHGNSEHCGKANASETLIKPGVTYPEFKEFFETIPAIEKENRDIDTLLTKFRALAIYRIHELTNFTDSELKNEGFKLGDIKWLRNEIKNALPFYNLNSDHDFDFGY